LAVTGLLSVFLPPQAAVIGILILWLIASLPQALLSVSFSVLMSTIAGPKGRYALMSRRWAIIGIVSAAMVALAGQILDHVRFPLNYQIAFVSFAVVSMTLSRIFTQRYILPPKDPPAPRKSGQPLREQIRDFARLILAERPFVAITIKRLVFIFGSQLVIPLFSLYYVRELQATDAQISLISTVQRAVLMVGYAFWPRQRDKRGSRFVLLCTTLAVALYPALTALNSSVGWMMVLAGVASVFSAGLNLVFFDELMKTVPPENSATFVAVTQSLQHFVVIIGPMISTTLADYIGLSGALLLGAGVRLVGFGLFWLGKDDAQSKTVRPGNDAP
jgi:Na+/melibiose symporter-like transporter